MSMTIGTTQVEIGNLATWPRPAELGFDEAQFQAYQAALTEECVLIQGPPGTGKTFLGKQLIFENCGLRYFRWFLGQAYPTLQPIN